jgi:hypothetical protein
MAQKRNATDKKATTDKFASFAGKKIKTMRVSSRMLQVTPLTQQEQIRGVRIGFTDGSLLEITPGKEIHVGLYEGGPMDGLPELDHIHQTIKVKIG